jgi:hypothetical protein
MLLLLLTPKLLKNKKTLNIFANNYLQAICLQLWLFGTAYDVCCVIINLPMANQVLSNFVPDIIILEANMLHQTEQHSLDLSEIKSQNIVLWVGGEGQPTLGNNTFKRLIEPFDREELLRILDEIPIEVKLETKA